MKKINQKMKFFKLALKIPDIQEKDFEIILKRNSITDSITILGLTNVRSHTGW